MNSNYHTNLPEVNFVFYLVAGIIERARLDLNGLEHPSRNCDVIYPAHRAIYCAREFLSKLETYKREHPEADHIEIALEVIRWQQ